MLVLACQSCEPSARVTFSKMINFFDENIVWLGWGLPVEDVCLTMTARALVFSLELSTLNLIQPFLLHLCSSIAPALVNLCVSDSPYYSPQSNLQSCELVKIGLNNYIHT